MSNLSRLAKTVAVLAVLTLGASACASEPGIVTADENPTSSAQPTGSATPEPTEATLSDRYPDDMTVPLERASDEFGDYIRVTVDPASTLGTYNPDVVTGDTNGFTEEDFQRAWEVAAKFLVEQGLDSVAADNPTVDAASWRRDQLGKSLSSRHFADTPGTWDVWERIVARMTPEGFIRDGGQRSHITGEITEMSTFTTARGEQGIGVTVTGLAVSPITSEENFRNYWAQVFLDQGAGETLEEAEGLIRDQHPFLYDNVEGNEEFQVTYEAVYNFIGDDLTAGLLSGWESSQIYFAPREVTS